MLTTLTPLQSKAKELFEAQEYAALIAFLKANGASQPSQFRPDEARVGQFGCRVSPTQWAVAEDDHWVVFTVDIDGVVAINLHGSLPQSVDWINGTMQQQWIHKSSIAREEADRLVIDCF